MPTPVWKDKAEEINTQADKKADLFLDKLKASKWTGAIVFASVAIVFVTLIFLF